MNVRHCVDRYPKSAAIERQAMANQFLIEIHDYLSRQIDAAGEAMQEAATRGDRERQQLNAGKIDELKALRAYCSENFDLLTQKYY
jgi:hypothetical protein